MLGQELAVVDRGIIPEIGFGGEFNPRVGDWTAMEFQRARCKLREWKLFNGSTGELASLDCKSWRCPEHGAMLWWRWWLRLREHRWSVFGTVTNVPLVQGDAQRLWREIRRWLVAEKFGAFVRVLETGSKNGMLHWHFLTVGKLKAGLPVGSWVFIGEKGRDSWKRYADTLTAVSEKWGGGFTSLRPVFNRSGAAGYALKYAVKSLVEEKGNVPKGYRFIVASRSVDNWKTVSSRRHGLVEKEVNWILKKGYGFNNDERRRLVSGIHDEHIVSGKSSLDGDGSFIQRGVGVHPGHRVDFPLLNRTAKSDSRSPF